MGSPLSPLLAEIYLQHIENTILSTYPIQPITWLRYVDDVFVIWPSSQQELHKLTDKITAKFPTIKFTINEEENNTINFLDVTIIKNHDNSITRTVYRKPTATTNIIPYHSHTLHNYKLSSFKSFIHRANLICNTTETLNNEYSKIHSIALEHNFPSHIVDKLIQEYHTKQPLNHILSPHTTKKHLPLIGSIPYYPRISCKLKKIFKHYGYNLIIKSNPNIMNIVLRDRDDIDPSDLPGIYSIPISTSSGDTVYIGSTARSIKRRLKEHQKDVKEGNSNTALSQLTLEDRTAIPRWSEVCRIAPFISRSTLLYQESIEISIRPNSCNTEEPITIPYIWKAFLNCNRDDLDHRNHVTIGTT